MNNGEQFFNTAAPTGYSISRSLRFNSADSSYLSRTPASAGNRKTWTWAGWVKRSDLTNQQTVWSAGSTGTNRSNVLFQGGGQIRFFNYAGSVDVDLVTTPVYRDASAWYHLVIAVDTTQATSANRVKLYVNGVQVTAFGTATYPSLNQDLVINSAIAHGIGRGEQSGGEYFSGYLADCFLIDSQALDPSAFGEFSATTGVWVPKAYSGGSYGTNGFHLEFADNSSNTATTLGKDTSGNGNNWTPNNLSVTAGAGNDSLVDVPTNGSEVDSGLGNQVRGNYCTGNPLAKNTYGSTLSFANGNLDWTFSGNAFATIAATSGKWYAEVVFNSVAGGGRGVGVGTYDGTQVAAYFFDGTKYLDGVNSSYSGVTYTTGDIIGIAWNADSKQVTFYKNNASQGAMTYTNTKDLTFIAFRGGVEGTNVCTYNFGQRPFAYTAPSGFKALCTANLPAPLVTKPSDVMDVTLWTGTNGANARTISGLGFSPDLVWIKVRNQSYSHQLFDAVRGTTRGLASNSTGAEFVNDVAGTLSAFNSDGFTTSPVTNNTSFNSLNDTYAAWCWDAGNTTVTNTQGSISSQVRANASAGFSIVTWTYGSSTATIGHGLGAAPGFILAKTRSVSYPWIVYHSALGADKYMFLDTGAAYTNVPGVFSDNSSTVFEANSGVFTASATYVAYCFAPVSGYSSFGSYTGNGSSTDGPFVYTGFRPKFVLIKRTDTSIESWWIKDSVRSSYNVMAETLFPNRSDAEISNQSARYFDFLSNGFKLRGNDTGSNGSGGTYIYAAFAESPFQYARAR